MSDAIRPFTIDVHDDVLDDLRGRLQKQMRAMPDLSYYPESELAKRVMDNPVAFGQAHRAEITELADIADLMLVSFDEAKPKIEAALKSDTPMKRYWGAMVCTHFGKAAASLTDLVRPLLDDKSEPVRVRALEFLGSTGALNPQPALTGIVNSTQDPVLAVEALNAVVWFKDHFDGKYPVTRADFHPVKTGGDIDDRLNYINGIPYPPNANKKAGKGKPGKKK